MINVADSVEEARRAGKAFLDRYCDMDTPAEIMDRWARTELVPLLGVAT